MGAFKAAPTSLALKCRVEEPSTASKADTCTATNCRCRIVGERFASSRQLSEVRGNDSSGHFRLCVIDRKSLAHDRQAAHLSRVVQNQRYPHHTVEEHEAARVDPEPIKDDSKQNRQDKATERAEEPDNAGDNTHVLR